MLNWNVGSSFSATDKSGLAVNSIGNSPLAAVVAVPCAISWLTCATGGIHQRRQRHQDGYWTCRTTHQRTLAPSTAAPVYEVAVPWSETNSFSLAAVFGASNAT